MVVELVAGRLIAPYLGSSLYTWTAIIGIVLAGITVGNAIGGLLADRYPPRKALAVVLTLSAMACIVILLANRAVGNWERLGEMTGQRWPARIFLHIAMVFLAPCGFLGMISPLVAKGALDRGLPAGRTIGDLYACGAAGSIVGTFLAGFWLIPSMGATAIVACVAGALLALGLLYGLVSLKSH